MALCDWAHQQGWLLTSNNNNDDNNRLLATYTHTHTYIYIYRHTHIYIYIFKELCVGTSKGKWVLYSPYSTGNASGVLYCNTA